MLTPEYLQGIPAELEALYMKLEEELIADICRRIAKAGSITETAEYQILRLKELGAGTDYIKRKITEYSEISSELCDRLFFDAAQTSDEFYNDVYRKAGKPYTPFEYNGFMQQSLQAAVNQTKGELRNMTGSMGFSYRGSDGSRRFRPAAEAYRDILDHAFVQLQTGAVDYTTAIRAATRKLTDSGLQYVSYDSGVKAHADVAARRAILTGISQYTGMISEHNAAELDTDIVEVSAHSGARPDHAAWQGKWYSLSGTSAVYPSLRAVTGYGTVTGLKGANCRHDFYPVIPGISEPMYTDKELAAIDPPPFEYNGKTYTAYEAEQRQREMERTIRKTKREILAADASGDEEMFTAKSVLLRRQREEYKKFSDAAGLLTQNDRNQAVGYGKSVSAKAVWAERKASGTNGSGNNNSSVPSAAGTPFQTSILNVKVNNSPTNQIVKEKLPVGNGKQELYRGYGQNSLTISEENDTIKVSKVSKSVTLPDTYTFLNKAKTNFDKFDENQLSLQVLNTINDTISKRYSESHDFSFRDIMIAKFPPGKEKSVFITDLEATGVNNYSLLYLNRNYFIDKTEETINQMCMDGSNSGWWKSKNLSDLVNHEIMHAKINYHNSYEKVERLYHTLYDDVRIKGFCRLVDKNPSEFMNEMYVALHNGSEIEQKYIDIYNEYAKEFLGG